MFQNIINKVKNYLTKTSDKLSDSVTSIFRNKKLDAQALKDLKEVLIATDVDYKTASELVDELSHSKFDKEISDEEVKLFLANKIIDILLPMEKKIDIKGSLHVIMFCGVNGNGKTTTIAKLANKFKLNGKKVMVAPCDTFRAAAEEQLSLWMQRIGCEIFIPPKNIKDPASVAYQAIMKSKDYGIDVLFIDTAGRLHTNTDLMNELKKIYNIAKKLTFASYETILVLDSTVGQNAFNQIQLFREIVNIDGLIITKLDGTAKAGVVVGIANQFKDLKLYAIGVGESLDDLHDFSAKHFAYNLLGLKSDV